MYFEIYKELKYLLNVCDRKKKVNHFIIFTLKFLQTDSSNPRISSDSDSMTDSTILLLTIFKNPSFFFCSFTDLHNIQKLWTRHG